MNIKIKLYQCGGEKPDSEYPLGLGYLKSNCTSADIEIVQNREDLTDCDMIGLSSNAHGAKEAVDILENVFPKIPIIVGGQITLWKGLKSYPFKCIIQGEGEDALNFSINNEHKFKFINSMQRNDIDTLKFPVRGKCRHTVPMLTSRGCPWNCSFCSSTKFWKNTRYHSAEYVIEEAKYILSHYPHAKLINILDDLFIADLKRFREIHYLWLKNKLHKKIKLHCFIRANIFTKKIGLMLKQMNFKSVRYGAESGSDKILKLLNKQATVAQNQKVIDICNEIDLPIRIAFMHDIPGETAEDKALTKKFMQINKGRFTKSGWYKFRPYPGTQFYNGEDITKMDMRAR